MTIDTSPYTPPRAPVTSVETADYSSTGSRVGAHLLDGLILAPIIIAVMACSHEWQSFSAFYFIPSLFFSLFYHVYLVKRFGGTPGKLMVGLRVRRLDGSAVGYREALLRFGVLLGLSAVSGVAGIMATQQMSDAEFSALSLIQYVRRLGEMTPIWGKFANVMANVWAWGNFLAILCNYKRRALHDALAGTVVLRWPLRSSLPEA